ncbi:hypothetical protein KIN20_027667 [Parelaphostrongylus tenuis]|uniref:Uncharacterized protein n=1 Tax=Parelaphostrongylus tenuis TaxID=148309 RepID=A0AAD5QZN7_PARTN|nr:hypothetical protein KIN20_027667 [Parelaphostrongylus tenuis]
MKRNFNVSGFRLPTAMVFTTSSSAPAQIPSGIANTSDGAKSFVSRLIMQIIVEVLEQQGRSAGLPDTIISSILNQLMVQINYDPLECKTVTVNPKADAIFPDAMMPLPHCIVIGNTVTALCTGTGNGGGEKCKIEGNMKIAPIDNKHLSITGSLTTTNIIMANWSRQMWQSIVNRTIRMLASGPFSSQFFSAFATIG